MCPNTYATSSLMFSDIKIIIFVHGITFWTAKNVFILGAQIPTVIMILSESNCVWILYKYILICLVLFKYLCVFI